MLYILLFIFLCFIIGATITETNSRYHSETAETVGGVGMLLFCVTLLVTVIAGVRYNYIKSTATAQLEVLNSQNEIVLAQIEPLVQHYCNPFHICPKCGSYVMIGWSCVDCGYSFDE